MDWKCDIYLVNGIDLHLFNVVKHGKIYRGFKHPKNKGNPVIVKSSEINAIRGNYQELTLRKIYDWHLG